MIVVDSSALLAILLSEPESGAVLDRMEAASGLLLSVANFVEAAQVSAQRHATPTEGIARFQALIDRVSIVLAPIDEVQAHEALRARIEYGRGFGHPAKLNYSDCFAYALAKTRALPLLFIGDDFTHTDIVSALP